MLDRACTLCASPQADRFYETYHIYKGAQNAVNTDKDTPGPGAYELASSSFRGVNAFGPPHTFGATNHDQTYATDSPGGWASFVAQGSVRVKSHACAWCILQAR